MPYIKCRLKSNLENFELALKDVNGLFFAEDCRSVTLLVSGVDSTNQYEIEGVRLGAWPSCSVRWFFRQDTSVLFTSTFHLSTRCLNGYQ